MSGESRVERAQLRELDARFESEINEASWLTVQFNPESLKVSFANQIQQPQGGGDQGGGASQQFVGAGSTKLAVQLWFDVSSDAAGSEDDVRKLTRKVAYFITPQPVQGQRDKFRPPILRFVWGSFQFDGIVEAMEESLEFFSPEGRPLRASVALTVTQQKIQFQLRELPPAPPGQSLQQLSSGSGNGRDWQSVAAANDVDNPRFLPPGQPLDMNPPRRT